MCKNKIHCSNIPNLNLFYRVFNKSSKMQEKKRKKKMVNKMIDKVNNFHANLYWRLSTEMTCAFDRKLNCVSLHCSIEFARTHVTCPSESCNFRGFWTSPNLGQKSWRSIDESDLVFRWRHWRSFLLAHLRFVGVQVDDVEKHPQVDQHKYTLGQQCSTVFSSFGST